MEVKWTDEQLAAIETKQQDGSILVSAAAGSGKTAVLVERVLSRLLNDQGSIDRMLIVTFTDAAASEMRDKIIRRMYVELQSAAKSGGDTEFIKRQIQLSASADILTIDSFCLRVLKNNFYVMGIDPDFRIADSAEAELLADDAADGLFNRFYCADEASEESIKFNHLLNIYATNRSDEGLKNLVLEIHRFIQSFARPIEWLDEKASMYDEDMENSVWVKKIVPELYIRRMGREYYRDFSELLRQMGIDCLDNYNGAPPAPDEKAELLEEYGEIVNGLCILQSAALELSHSQSWADAHDVYEKYVRTGGGIDGLTLRNKPKGINADLDDWKRFCKARNDLKKSFFEDCSAFETADMTSLLHGASLKTQVDELVWLVKEFDAEYERRKDLRNTREFSDIEHLVYRLFSENEEVRALYRDKYDEILIDEYQDTNGLQDSIFELISQDGKNLFMVGDLKQSIYRFRGGDPTIFKGKSKRYALPDSADIRIDLSQNFRSRQEILHSVNDVFESIMSEDLGDVNYAGKERIVRHLDKDDRDSEYKSEAHFVVYNKSGDEDLTALEAEAEFIADKIYDMVNGGLMIDDGNGKRPVKSRDICILSRSVRSGAGAVLTNALTKRGVNSYVEIEDYFEKREVRLIMSLISVIDNNLQDIPLTAVMRSPIGGFSDNDLARIRIYSPKGDLFSAMKNYRSDEDGITDEEIALKIKCRNLVKNLEKWRRYVKRKSVANLIWSIYEETGLYDFMGALEGGEESQANLRLLYERAKHYEQSGFKGLFNFIKYIEKLEGRKNDLSSANLIGEGHDVVRIMTIHKSKGLEFPVVFLTGMGKSIKPRSSGAVALHKDLGFGIRYADADAGYFEDTLPAQLVREQNRREDISEAMRLLYVAMTRPKYKLITVASKRVSDSESKSYWDKAMEQVEKWENGIFPADAKSYADWIYPAAMRNTDNWSFEVHNYILNAPAEEEEKVEKEIIVSDELREVIRKSFEYEYKYPKSGYIPAKTSVTALKQKSGEEEPDVENANRKYEYDPIYMVEMPAFMQDKKRGTEIGTAHHQVMAYIDIEKLRNLPTDKYELFAEQEIERLVGEGQLNKFYFENDAMRESIAVHVAGFFASELGQRMIRAEKLYREQPFQIEIGADVYDASLDEKYGDEKVILQGVIDCFFEREDGGVVLVDYKTDRCSTDAQAAKIVEKYAIQLRLYTDAIERITGKIVAERYLFLFSVNREISVK